MTNLGNQVLALRHVCADFPRKAIVHAGSVPITVQGELDYSYESGMFSLSIPELKTKADFYPTNIVQIDGIEVWVD